MSMVFDNFATRADAEAFVAAVKARFDLDGQTFATDHDSYADDPGPFTRRPYIAHVDRVPVGIEHDEATDIALAVVAEERVEEFAAEFGGEFIGT
jgi:hypothetical protein